MYVTLREFYVQKYGASIADKKPVFAHWISQSQQPIGLPVLDRQSVATWLDDNPSVPT